MDLHTPIATFYSPKAAVPTIPRRHRSPRIATTLCVISALGVLSGCTIDKVSGNQHKDPTPIQIGDFHADPNAPVSPSTPADPDTIASAPASSTTSTPDNHTQTPESSAPVLAAGTPAPARSGIMSGNDGLEFIDAKVGDISGHPIYVSSFFQPIADRLIASAENKTKSQWREEAESIVASRLNGIIYDELLRAETIAALTPQQRVGLQSFLKDFRSNLLSENLGSKELANQRILEEQGITLDEALRQKELDTLVWLTLHREINERINISWRDIQQRYERDIDKYQPKPTVVLQLIRVLQPEGELVDSITKRLNEGEPFAELAASDFNTFNKETQGIFETTLTDDFEKTSFFQLAPLNEAIWTLSEGEWTGPVSLGDANFWVLYAEKHQVSKTLYEAQLEISRELHQERQDIERKAYLNDLIERSRVSNLDEILYRLLYIAEKQYGPLQ